MQGSSGTPLWEGKLIHTGNIHKAMSRLGLGSGFSFVGMHKGVVQGEDELLDRSASAQRKSLDKGNADSNQGSPYCHSMWQHRGEA